MNQVQTYTDNGAGVAHCAIGKAQSDGGGNNVIEPSCGPAFAVITQCVSSVGGYPYVINQSSSPHVFSGDVGYNGQCIP